VRVLWGTLIFYGRMSSMSVQHTLFKPSGDPLRAKVDLTFVEFISAKEADLLANRSSPDLTHLSKCARATRCRCCATASTATRPIMWMSHGSTAWTPSVA